MNEENDRLTKLLRSADRVPDAPDCRGTVMARIAGERRRPALVWTYACAAVLVVILALSAALWLRPSPRAPVDEISRKPAPVSAPTQPEQVVRQAEPKEEPQQTETQVVAAERKPEAPRAVQKTIKSRPRVVRRHRPVQAPSPKPRPPEPAVVESPPSLPEPPAPVAEPPIASVAVSYQPDQGADTSCEYTQCDPETGQVTRCSSARSGNSIQIYLESSKGGQEPPVKGSVDHEPIPNV